MAQVVDPQRFDADKLSHSPEPLSKIPRVRLIKRLPTAEKPNGSVYAAPFRKVYVSNTNGKAVAIVDVEKDQIVKTLEFKSETGMPQYDSVAKKVYVNLRSTNEVAEIDPASDSVVGQYAVEECQHNHGMAMDSEHIALSSLRRQPSDDCVCAGYA